MQTPNKISERIIYESPWRKIILKKIKIKDKIIHEYPIQEHSWENYATMLIAITEDKQVIYWKEWRPWIEGYVMSFTVWLKEENITFKENALKELKEEVWWISTNIEYLWESIVANFDSTLVKYFIALNVKEWNQELEEWEIIEKQKCSIEEFEERIKTWTINCPLTITCYTLAKLNWYL